MSVWTEKKRNEGFVRAFCMVLGAEHKGGSLQGRGSGIWRLLRLHGRFAKLARGDVHHKTGSLALPFAKLLRTCALLPYGTYWLSFSSGVQ